MRDAFTLIELLVVITIIVVLLALLAPALDKAIYQAELAVCQATLGAGASGVLSYAMQYRRRYPNRKLPEAGWPAMVIYDPLGADDRPVLSEAFSLNGALNCPLAAETDIAGSQPSSFTWVQYNMWFDFQYRPGTAQAEPGSFRLGDRLGWEGERFSLLMGDWSSVTIGGNWVSATHPDRDGVMSLNHYQDEPNPFFPGQPITGVAANQATWSWWSANTKDRGPLDLNFSFADGSAERFADVSWRAGEPGVGEDERIAKVPDFAHTDDGWPDRRSQIPRR